MANVDVIKPSYDALKTMRETIRAFAELSDLVPEEDSLSSLWQILVDRIEADMVVLNKEAIKLLVKEHNMDIKDEQTHHHILSIINNEIDHFKKHVLIISFFIFFK